MEIIKGQRPENYSRTPIGKNKEVINALFATIKIAYPHFLKDQVEGDVKRMWLLHLQEFPSHRIEAGTLEMVDKYPTFPPTIGLPSTPPIS